MKRRDGQSLHGTLPIQNCHGFLACHFSFYIVSDSRTWRLVHLVLFPFLPHQPVRRHFNVKATRSSEFAGALLSRHETSLASSIRLEILGMNANASAQGQQSRMVVAVFCWYVTTLDKDEIVRGRDLLPLPRADAFTVSLPSDDAFISGGVLSGHHRKGVIGGSVFVRSYCMRHCIGMIGRPSRPSGVGFWRSAQPFRITNISRLLEVALHIAPTYYGPSLHHPLHINSLQLH